MFRLEFLKLKNHPQLGDINLNLCDVEELRNIEKPYTSVIIGANGTGKSFILKTIADIFSQVKAYSNSDKKGYSVPFDFHMRYKLNKNTYEIILLRKDSVNEFIAKGKELFLFKNHPGQYEIFTKGIFKRHEAYKTSINELEFPEKLIVNSIIPTDRFIFKNSTPDDFYQYLGARSTSSTTSTKSAVKKTIKHIFNATNSSNEFKESLKELLTFLDFKESFKVEYNTKIIKLFFSMSLELKDFKMYFEKWWDEDFMYTNRKEENPLWSIPYYNKHFKENPELTKELIGYLNELPQNEKLFHKKKNSSSKIITLDLFDIDLTERDLLMISHLENLDIINLQGMRVQKSNSTLSTNEISSGEYHLLNSLIGIFATITKDSLILIDEPEISLHPNWQMRYITFLKKVFAKYPSCHFILSTHSHFLVSDLEGESSSVTALNRDIETNQLSARLLEIDTYGWSAEDVLYNIFNVRSSLNYYLQADLTELLGMIANNIKDVEKIGVILNKLNALPKRENDPLQEIIIEATEYLNSIQ